MVGSDSKVVSFMKRTNDRNASPLAEVRAYWEGLRDGRGVPLRSDVDPRGIERALEHAFIIERIAHGGARFRVAGMQFSDLLGMEARGMPFSTFFEPRARDGIGSALATVFDGPATATARLVAETGLGRPPLSAQLLVLPLRSDLGDVSRALGCLVCDGEIGRAPRRFEIGHLQLCAIEGAATPAAEPTHEAGFADPGARYHAAAARIETLQDGTARPSRGHLRLVVSGD